MSFFTAEKITKSYEMCIRDRDGNLFGYVPGMITRSVMEQIVQQTLDGSSRS